MLSIIAAIHNQLGVNKLFYESIIKNTSLPFELIIIDNSSTDGSVEFFQGKPNVKVISTGANYNYPYCQNLGIKHAKYDMLCFFNNDVLLTKDWDTRMMHIFNSNDKIEVLSFATNEHLENKEMLQKISRRWKRIKYPLQFVGNNTSFILKTMIRFMYGDLNSFSEKRFKTWAYQTIEGYSGSVIAFKRGVIEKIGLWDERVQAADFDIFNRLKEYSLKDKNVLPLQLALGIYFHHFQRLTVKQKYPPFANRDIMLTLDEKWGERTNELRKDIVG